MTGDVDELHDFILSSQPRGDVMRHLWDGEEARPIEIANAAGKRRQRISEALAELENKGLVECVNPDGDERARWYRITDLGREVWLPPRDEL